MKTLILALMLISPYSLANWGDTYYCSTTMNFSVKPNGSGERYIKEKEFFKFNLDEKRESLNFAEKAPFGDLSLKVTFSIFARDGQESFDLKGSHSVAAYHNGTFTYSYASTWGARVVTADCQIM